jgi:hypothetical protein
MKTPRACFCLADDCITSFISFEDFVFERVFDGVGFARVLKLLKAVECGSKEDPRYRRVHTRYLMLRKGRQWIIFREGGGVKRVMWKVENLKMMCRVHF